MKNLLRLLLKSQQQRNRSEQAQTEKGMTLIELLIGTVMAFLIITPMLSFVVDMLNTDRREQVKSNTEQDIQAAVDFIAQDLSEAIYIYDNNTATDATATGIPAIRSFLPNPSNQTPILVFWKRQKLRNSLPTTAGALPSTCDTTTIPAPLSGAGACNDSYVLSLVAYYQVSDNEAIWCQPSGGTCPNRIVRYQIQDGLKNPAKATNPDPAARYFIDAELGSRSGSLKLSPAFNIGTTALPGFDISQPTVRVTNPGINWEPSQVLVNYLDHSPSNTQGLAFTGTECTTALGNPTTQNGAATEPIREERLKVFGATNNSFYACVDTQRNIARVTIRGNTLRRLQTNDANYDAKKSAFFPTASVQVQGRGARGK